MRVARNAVEVDLGEQCRDEVRGGGGNTSKSIGPGLGNQHTHSCAQAVRTRTREIAWGKQEYGKQ